MDKVAEEFGTTGTRARKTASYEMQRAEHRAELTERSTAWETDMLARGYVNVRGSLFFPPPPEDDAVEGELTNVDGGL